MLDDRVMNELDIVARRGGETAGESLSLFLGRKTTIEVNNVSLMSLDQVSSTVGNDEALVVALLCQIDGEISGNSALFFRESDAVKLVKILGSKESRVEDFDAMERSMLEETANISISSFMNCLTSHLSKAAKPSAPQYLHDYAGAIISVILAEAAEFSDKAIVFSTSFHCAGEGMEVYLSFMPDAVAMAAMEEGLD